MDSESKENRNDNYEVDQLVYVRRTPLKYIRQNYFMLTVVGACRDMTNWEHVNILDIYLVIILFRFDHSHDGNI